MKTSKLQKLAWVFFALTLTATTVFSQGRRNGNRNFKNQNLTCLEQISDLSEQQKSQIISMEKSHQETMVTLRENRRSTSNSVEKDKIREEMLKTVNSYQSAVKKLLTKEQQNQYNPQKNQRNSRNNQQFARRNRGGNRGNQSRFYQQNQKNNMRNQRGCRGNKRNRRGNGNGNNS